MSTSVLSLVRRGEVWSNAVIDVARCGTWHPNFVRYYLGGDPARFESDETYRAELVRRIPKDLVRDAEEARREYLAAKERGDDWVEPRWYVKPVAVIRPAKEER